MTSCLSLFPAQVTSWLVKKVLRNRIGHDDNKTIGDPIGRNLL
jgi:hypothetical protein